MAKRKPVKAKAPRTPSPVGPAAVSAMLNIRGVVPIGEQLSPVTGQRFRVARPLLDPTVPDAIFEGFAAVGVPGPYCQFLWQEPWTPEAMAEESRQLNAAPDLEGRIRVAQELGAKRWFLLDDNATDWSHVEVVRKIVFTPYGWGGMLPPRFGTRSGKVEQWITLSRMFTAALRITREAEQMRCDPVDVYGSDADRADAPNLTIATSSTGPWKALYRYRSEGLPDAPETGLSQAGAAVLIWAVAHVRLRGMFDDIADMGLRLRMPAITSYLAGRKPVLEWAERELELLGAVRAELTAIAPRWRSDPGAALPAIPPLALAGAQPTLEADEYRPATWFRKGAADRLRKAASTSRKSKRVRTKKIDGVVCYCVADVRLWWAELVPENA